jgi:hypothetical protein
MEEIKVMESNTAYNNKVLGLNKDVGGILYRL